MKWKIAEAKQKFSRLLRAAEKEPQWIYNRDQRVAVIVDAKRFDLYRQCFLETKQKSLAASFGELRQLCLEEEYQIETPVRRDRKNTFAAMVDHASM